MRLVSYLILTTLTAQLTEPSPPQAPMLALPADDPDGSACLKSLGDGIKLYWNDRINPYPIADYVEVRRFDVATKQWRPWLKQYTTSPFTMVVRPNNSLFYNSQFEWRVWSVDKSGHSRPYATASSWRQFCTGKK